MMRGVLRAAALLASVLLIAALPAAASGTAAAKSVTVRVLIMPVTRTFTDVPPKTHATTGEYTTGDTLRGTSILRNAVRQFGKPKGARVGSSRFVFTALSARRFIFDGVATLPGGSLRTHGVLSKIGGNLTVTIVGGTGLYAGASGYVETRLLANGVQLDIARLRLP
jgi:hypothetical protein